MIEYVPVIYENPTVRDVISAWGKIPAILKDIILRFGLKQNSALEFGVECGYSTSAIANYFKKVRGVDKDCSCASLHAWPNIEIIESTFEDYIKTDNNRYDLIHIDIIHDFLPTYLCGEWSVNHSDCVIFHDTISNPEVFQACEALASNYGFEFYNYPNDFGLGILIKK
jgi:hypothetical protein